MTDDERRRAAAAREADRYEALANACAIPTQAAECRRLAALARDRSKPYGEVNAR